MILKNKNGKERELCLLLKIQKNSNEYMVYKDYLTNNIYAGKLVNNKLVSLNNEEYNNVNKLLERMEG